jgi:uncharacterized spore protein YtfJ
MNDKIVPARDVDNHPINTVNNVLVKFNAAARVEAVYHEPVLHGENLIIPAAEIVSTLGFGVGGGNASENGKNDTGGGGGGGGTVFSRPVAVIVSNAEGVEVRPIIDITKVALAGMTTGVIFLGTLARLLSLRKKIDNITDDLMKGH